MRSYFNLSHGERIERRNPVRRAKAAQRAARRAERVAVALPSTLEQWIDGSDTIRARGMGIRLELTN